jgi:hypothetical protein
VLDLVPAVLEQRRCQILVPPRDYADGFAIHCNPWGENMRRAECKSKTRPSMLVEAAQGKLRSGQVVP